MGGVELTAQTAKPMEHQQEALDKCRDKEAFAYLMEMGTGKTFTDIWDTDYLFNGGKIDGWLIFAPKGIYRNWVTKELPKWAKFHYRCCTFNASNLKAAREQVELVGQGPIDPRVLDIMVMNTEGLAFPGAKKALNQFIRTHKAIKTSLDESTQIKGPESKRTLAAHKMRPFSKYRRILTGFPLPNSPLDAWAQFMFLDPKILKYSNWHAMRAHYAVLKSIKIPPRMVRGKDGQIKKLKAAKFQKVLGYRNLPELARRMDSCSYRALKKDCLDLEPKIYMTREIEMTDEQWTAYNDLVRYGRAELSLEDKVTTAHVLTQMMRLQQIVAGHTKTDEGKIIYIKNNRMTALMDHVNECGGKVIIWSGFVPAIEEISQKLAKEFGPETVEAYYGKTHDKLRPEIVQRFEDDDTLRFFVGNPSTGGTGLTLNGSHDTLYYSNSYNLEHRVQSEDRNHRIGQLFPVTYTDFIARGTVDEKITNSMITKKKISTEALGEEWEEWIQ